MFGWLFGRKRDDEFFLKMMKAAAEGHHLAKIREAIATISSDPLPRPETEMAGAAAAILAKTVTELAIKRIHDDDDRFCAGMFAFVFADHFSRLAAGNFELAAFSAVLNTLGVTEVERCFNAIVTSHTNMAQSDSKILVAIGTSCNAWLEEPTRQKLERLAEIFKVTRKCVTEM